MREIKFRAWRDGVMDYELEEATAQECGLNYLITYMQSSQQTILMQFTGLLDKNGREIYEGDIVRQDYKAGYSTLEILFGVFDNGETYEANESGNGWYVKETTHFNDGSSNEVIISSISGYPMDTYPHEVIGNIYENPELLEEK